MKLGILLVPAFALFAACGPAPCDVLQKQCDECANLAAKALCTTTVATKVLTQDACKAAVDAKTYEKTGSACTAANP